MVAVVIAALIQVSAPDFIGFIPVPPPSAGMLVPIFILLIAVLSLFLDRFGTSLRDAIGALLAPRGDSDLRAAIPVAAAGV